MFKNQDAMDILCRINDIFEDVVVQEIVVGECFSPSIENILL